MRHKWPIATLSSLIAVAAIYGALVLLARPAPDHPYFAAEKPRTQVIAHRGGAHARPENTLAAFAHAVEAGADILEMDAQPTADGAIVLMHDATVDRTTDGTGRVESLSASQLRNLDAGYRWTPDGGQTFPFRGQGIRAPELGEVFARFPATRMIVEMKHGGPALAQPLCMLIRRHAMVQKTLVASMNEEAVIAFRRACPEVATSMTGSEARTFYFLHLFHLEAAYSPPAPALLIPDRIGGDRIPTRRLIEAAQRRNLTVHVWTIRDDARMRQLIEIEVGGIITDRPNRLLELLRHPASSR
ncbi:MAG: glycerophosphodiester phosphodiesterase [Betaproteobacteria bacterium]|nr:glycerophosphodiester phosphodiesterase [Betaproteobacteria bacterium]